MKNTKWLWKRQPKGAPTAEIAGKYIEKIKRKRKGITPQLLVIEAKDKKSPLHNCFEWNNTKAAEQYRIIQAREILRFLIVVIQQEEDETTTVQYRAFISPVETEQEESTSYLTIDEVCNDEELSKAYQRQLKNELNAIKEKIKNFPIFKNIVREIEKVNI